MALHRPLNQHRAPTEKSGTLTNQEQANQSKLWVQAACSATMFSKILAPQAVWPEDVTAHKKSSQDWVLQLGEAQFLLRADQSFGEFGFYLEAEAMTDKAALGACLEVLNVSHDDIIATHQDLCKAGSYHLLRMDDNGGEYTIASFSNYLAGFLEQRVYEKRGHKQIYYVSPS